MSSAETVARAGKEAFDASQLLDASERTKALLAIQRGLTEAKQDILAANARDVQVSQSHTPPSSTDGEAGSERASCGRNNVLLPFEATRPPLLSRQVRLHAPRHHRRLCLAGSDRTSHLCHKNGRRIGIVSS